MLLVIASGILPVISRIVTPFNTHGNLGFNSKENV